jgi:hypothetical protein
MQYAVSYMHYVCRLGNMHVDVPFLERGPVLDICSVYGGLATCVDVQSLHVLLLCWITLL